MKKVMLTLMLVTTVLCATACGTKKPETPANTESQQPATPSTEAAPTDTPAATGDTIGSKYLSAFEASSAATAGDAADELIAVGAFEAELVKMDVEPGYLDGFKEEINGFTAGAKFAPMIGSIPFVGYVFETEDPDALMEQLVKTADPRWNICTGADETVKLAKGNLVFFLMCTNEE